MELGGHQRCHIVVVPYPGRGHINPMFTFCNQLLSYALKQQIELSLTIIFTEEWAAMIDPNEIPGNSRVVTIPNVIPSEHGRGSNNEGFLEAVATRMEEPAGRVIDGLEGPKANAIIADTFLPWVVSLGSRINIPVASFMPILASNFLAIHHVHLLVKNGHYPLDHLIGSRGDERIDYIPGIGSTRLADLPLALHSYKKIMLDLMLHAMSCISKAQFMILRTLDELEGPAIDALKTIFPKVPTFTIGPTIGLPRESSPIDGEVDYIQWLDSQPQGSVLFVSLGSHLLPSRAQMEELAVGIANSGVPYLFVGLAETEFLKGLCGERGFIVKWCDQIKVLYHKSIGGFLNHGGLNSVLESLFAGVPMLTFPLGIDHALNSKLVVEDWGVGWRLRDKIEKDVLVKRDKVREVVQKFMDFDQNDRKEMNKHSKELKEVLWKAIDEESKVEDNVALFLQETMITSHI